MQENYQSYSEIHSQSEYLSRTMAYIREQQDQITEFFKPEGDIVFMACGSSYWMSLSACKTMHLKTGRKSFAVKGGDILLCPEEFRGLYENPLVICPSRSGLTSEVLKALAILRELYPNLKVLSIVEYENSELSRVSDLVLNIPWANEISVCQTRSFSCLYLASILIAELASGSEKLFADTERYLNALPALSAEHGAKISRVVEEKTIGSLSCLGCGLQYGVCIEGAYIVIEMAEFASNYYQLLEYRHGPIVTANADALVFILSCEGAETYQKKLATEAEKAGATIYVVAAQDQPYGAYTFAMGGAYPKELVAMHYVFCLQSLAYYLSVKHGKNPDSPGTLVPYIEL